jgi:transposase
MTIPVPSGARVWLATGRTDMRKGFDGLALLVQETLNRDPHGGHLFVFRGRRGNLIKVLWHDGQGMCLFSKFHGDETPVPVLAKGQTATGRAWVYVRDDRPFGGHDPPAAVFFYSRDRAGEHAERHLHGHGGILQADCYAGFNRLYEPSRNGGPITEPACWAHARRKFFVLADVTAKARGKLAVIAPMAFEAVKRIDAIIDVEREINDRPTLERLVERELRVAPLVADLKTWMRTERAKLSRHSEVAKAMDYMLKRWAAFARFLSDGRICLTNNAAERELRGIALGRKPWLFAGSDRGGERAAVMYTLIQTAKLNDVDPQAWLADVLARINDHNIQALDQLLPWNWKNDRTELAA